jgi:hypothetical protein|tara:strand:+ start:2316 stop:2534 length:219 start_codon:yes stop_codon:yes gene_type:complete
MDTDLSGESNFLSNGAIVNLYDDYQNEEGLLGRARLIKKLKDSPKFISNDSSSFKKPLASQIVFIGEYWVVE